MTVNELSERTGGLVSTSTIQKIEARRHAGTPATFAALALALDTTRATIDPSYVA